MILNVILFQPFKETILTGNHSSFLISMFACFYIAD